MAAEQVSHYKEFLIILGVAGLVVPLFLRIGVNAVLAFLIVGILLAAVCGTVELASRVSTNGLYQAGVALAAAGGFSLVFINLAVGIIGDEQDPRNLVFMAIPVVGFLGELIARFKAAVLVRLLVGMAAVQFFAMFLAPADLMSLMIPFTGIFVGLWLVCALLIRRSTRA